MKTTGDDDVWRGSPPAFKEASDRLCCSWAAIRMCPLKRPVFGSSSAWVLRSPARRFCPPCTLPLFLCTSNPRPPSPACAPLHSRCTVNASQHAGLSNHRSCRLPSWLVMCLRSTGPQHVAPRTYLNHGTLLLRRLSRGAPQLPTPPLCLNLSHGLVFTTVRSPSKLVTSSPSGGPGLVSCSLPPSP